MSVPSMVHRSGDSLIVRSVVSGDALYGSDDGAANNNNNSSSEFVDDDDHNSSILHEQQQQQQQSYQKDLPECKVKRNYSCNTCDFFTQNPRHYLYHLRDVHEEKVKIYECPNCLYASKHFQKLLRHTKMVHGTESLVRQQQQQQQSTKNKQQQQQDDDIMDIDEDDGMMDDYEDVGERVSSSSGTTAASSSAGAAANNNNNSSSTIFKCSVCSFTAKTRGQLNRHEREEHIKTKFFRCTKCSYATHMKARFTKHVKYHSMPMIKCDMCDFRTPYKWNLDRHCKNHNGRGAFRCSACNFTADIKQSLTVHEMNHHVPPVGQAAGLGVGRRRNKVGASDATAAEDAARQQQQQQNLKDHQQQEVADDQSASPSPPPAVNSAQSTTTTKKSSSNHKPDHTITTTSSSSSFGPDFIHPDDIIHHANGNVYIKNKCKHCNFKSAWPSEMAKHEKKVHNLDNGSSSSTTTNSGKSANNNNSNKKSTRPIPNLIPIPNQSGSSSMKSKATNSNKKLANDEPTMSQEDIQDICSKSQNSALKDFASLCCSEDVFETSLSLRLNNEQVPDLLPAMLPMKLNRNSVGKSVVAINNSQSGGGDEFKQKNASFFDKLKEKLMSSTGAGGNLLCNCCGHESKCLTEQAQHQKICVGNNKDFNGQTHKRLTPFISSSRCQYCRQRCKSSADLYMHLQTCSEALKSLAYDNESENELKIDESQSDGGGGGGGDGGSDSLSKPHPMENRVFVWNNIEAPNDLEMEEMIKYEYEADKIDDNVSLDYSIRTQSPDGADGSENSFVDYSSAFPTNNNNNNNNHHQQQQHSSGGSSTTNIHHSSPIADKIPTHGNDISVAQHKRVFKCPHCTFWASTASRFHVHIVGHLNKKPFECSLCSYRSNWRWDITKHIKLKSVRDPQHETAKVLMTDETGRRNYTKYNKYLTEIHVSGNQTLETSGGSGTRPRHNEQRNSSPANHAKGGDLPKLTRAPLNNGADGAVNPLRNANLRPPPPLKAADGTFFSKNRRGNGGANNNNNNAENKRTLFQCKKCNFRDASRETLLAHVKGHYQNATGMSGGGLSYQQQQQQLDQRASSPDKNEASTSSAAAKGTQAPFRCGHCNQVSSWKHVIQRHCRLKHSGDIRVVSTKNGEEKIEIEKQCDDNLDHVDVAQNGQYKCDQCPYSSNEYDELQAHLPGHSSTNESIMKCHYCTYFVNHKGELIEHLRLHGIVDPEDFIQKMALSIANPFDSYSSGGNTNNADLLGKRFRCAICPYVTNSKSQFTYHKQFHRPRGGQYQCTHCTYNVSKRHLLHQHLKVHGINITPQKQSGDVIDLDEISDEIEEITTTTTTPTSSTTSNLDSINFADIPLVWVSKSGKFSKMFKCRFCPHVNLRKVNIQEHEKMHSVREKNPNSSRTNDVEHRCTECNYICNNAGVLSSHSKVHQGLCGIVHCIVDQDKSDEEQIRELSRILNPQTMDQQQFDDVAVATTTNGINDMMENDDDNNTMLYFCQDCPARFLRENEYNFHNRLHGVRLFYKCTWCTYSAREKPHLLAHNKVHTNEYQERTRVLQTLYASKNTPPEICGAANDNSVWLVPTTSDKFDLGTTIAMKSSSGASLNVPLSGTELFQQKSEAQQKIKDGIGATSPKRSATAGASDPQFGHLMHGNPKFVYPTYLKNGRMKEKRYKCPKCPSAFEKREQYKIHLNLHGSKQRYNCPYCDYSVKYYANFVQHVKKHKVSSEAMAAREEEDDGIMELGVPGGGGGDEESDELLNNNEMWMDEENADDKKLLVSDQQTYNILQQRLLVNTSPNNSSSSSRNVSGGGGNENIINEEKKMFTCTNCPYVNYRKDAVENHQKRHVSVSGIKSNYMCEHCDYTVPQVHFLREHTKLHFLPNNKINNSQIDGYMVCDNLKLTSSKCRQDEEEAEEVLSDEGREALSSSSSSSTPSIIFEEKNGGDVDEKKFLPELSGDVTERFNNNDGEKQFVNLATGEVAAAVASDTTTAAVATNTNGDNNNKMDES